MDVVTLKALGRYLRQHAAQEALFDEGVHVRVAVLDTLVGKDRRRGVDRQVSTAR